MPLQRAGDPSTGTPLDLPFIMVPEPASTVLTIFGGMVFSGLSLSFIHNSN